MALAKASSGQRVVTPAGMVLDGRVDKITPPPGPDAETGQYELDPAIVDHLEFYILNYFRPGLGKQDPTTTLGRAVFNEICCNSCHISDLVINDDRRVADLNTVYDPASGNFNSPFSTATALINQVNDGTGLPSLKRPQQNHFVVKNIFTRPLSDALQRFLNALVLFPPDDTASTLDPGDRSTPDYPQFGHGSIKLTVLFNDPTDPE